MPGSPRTKIRGESSLCGSEVAGCRVDPHQISRGVGWRHFKLGRQFGLVFLASHCNCIALFTTSLSLLFVPSGIGSSHLTPAIPLSVWLCSLLFIDHGMSPKSRTAPGWLEFSRDWKKIIRPKKITFLPVSEMVSLRSARNQQSMAVRSHLESMLVVCCLRWTT